MNRRAFLALLLAPLATPALAVVDSESFESRWQRRVALKVQPADTKVDSATFDKAVKEHQHKHRRRRRWRRRR